jgi:hypothetical protein
VAAAGGDPNSSGGGSSAGTMKAPPTPPEGTHEWDSSSKRFREHMAVRDYELDQFQASRKRDERE